MQRGDREILGFFALLAAVAVAGAWALVLLATAIKAPLL